MKWLPWKKSEETTSRDAVRQVIETHKRAALEVIGMAATNAARPEGDQRHG